MSHTLKQLIALFCDETDSPFHNLQYQVRVKHQRLLERISREHGNHDLHNIRARNLLAWHKSWMSGGKTAMARALVSQLRVLFRFGATLLEDPECLRLLNTLREIRFPKNLPRKPRMTIDQVKAVRVKAHWRGWGSIALAQALQFTLMLRQKDVIGEWVPLTEPGTSDTKTERHGKWLRGLRWSQIDENMILRNNHDGIEFDLRAPMVIEELALYSRTPVVRLTRAALPALGPMIVCEVTGYPYLTAEFRRNGKSWRNLRESLAM